MEVILTKEAEDSLRKFIFDIAYQEFERAKSEVGIDRPLNQTEIAEYFDVSTTTIRVWENDGMPYATMGPQTKFYDRLICKDWVMNQKR
ncbi:MerR family transcriptional regulator [Vagococcus sp. JNUCC 83]